MIRLVAVSLLMMFLMTPGLVYAQAKKAEGLGVEDLGSILAEATKNAKEATTGGLDLLPKIPCEAVSNEQVHFGL